MIARTAQPVKRFTAALTLGAALSASAVEIRWADWNTVNTARTAVTGTITTPTSTIDINYSNPNQIAFLLTGAVGETDYWRQQTSSGLARVPATSPYTSSTVDNIPTGTDLVGLRYDGMQTLTFSETVANPVFSYISLNFNGYAFDRDFDILSVGSVDGNDAGYWGTGTSSKSIVEISPGVMEYRLIGTGEPHGTLRFKGAFDSVSWRSLSDENWNGFTVGIEGTAAEVFPTPDGGASLAMLSLALGALAVGRRGTRR